MNSLEFNHTPVRTSQNFGMNSITLENFAFPEKIGEFKNIEMEIGSSEITDKVSTTPFTYGTGKVLEKQILENANHKLQIKTNKKKEEIRITYLFDDNQLNLVNKIEIEANQDTNVIIEYKSNTNQKCFHNGILHVIAKENTNVNVIIINLLNENSNHFEAIENEIEEQANVNYTMIDIGGKNSISNYYAKMMGKQAGNTLKTIYLGRKNQVKDINYIAELRGEKSWIDIDVQGALKDESKKNFKGTIDFKKGCKKAKGNENEFCMMLSDKAKSLALPMLLCTEDDVEGNHSTASGKVNQEELFYIMSRGMSYQEAIKLIIRARFHEILERLTDETLRNEIVEEINQRLD